MFSLKTDACMTFTIVLLLLKAI